LNQTFETSERADWRPESAKATVLVTANPVRRSSAGNAPSPPTEYGWIVEVSKITGIQCRDKMMARVRRQQPMEQW